MASSATEVANIALVNCLGQKRISALTEGSAESIPANVAFGQARDFVTEMGVWRHARGRQTLEELADNDREDEWGYAYQRPSDCLRLRYLLPETGTFDPTYRIRYDLEGETIYSNERSARIVYVKQATDVTKWPPSFVWAVAWYLAHMLVQPLELDKKFFAATLDGFRQAVDHAVRIGDMEENFPLYEDASQAQPDWMQGRGG